MATTNVMRAFSEEHVSRLTGLTLWQLRSWDRRGFFEPHYAYENRRQPYSRIYSFQDVVGLRTIAALMKEHRVPLKELIRAADELVRRGYGHWAGLRLYVVKRRVYFQKPGTREVEGVWDGQLAMLPVIDMISDVEEKARELQKRSDRDVGKIEKNKYITHNTPVIAGTRVATAAIRRFSEAGYSPSQIMREYPNLTAEDVAAALAYEERLANSA